MISVPRRNQNVASINFMLFLQMFRKKLQFLMVWGFLRQLQMQWISKCRVIFVLHCCFKRFQCFGKSHKDMFDSLYIGFTSVAWQLTRELAASLRMFSKTIPGQDVHAFDFALCYYVLLIFFKRASSCESTCESALLIL